VAGPRRVSSPAVLPPKERVLSDMEARIHHFILVTRGFPVPKGEAYACIESPKGGLGFYVVADGSDGMADRLRRVLTTDPGMGVLRHADAGYETAVEFAREQGIDRAT